jgi:hypothetical protein
MTPTEWTYPYNLKEENMAKKKAKVKKKKKTKKKKRK